MAFWGEGDKKKNQEGKTQERNAAYPHLYILQDFTKGAIPTEADVDTRTPYIAV